MNCYLKYFPLLLGLTLTLKFGVVPGDIVEFSGQLTCVGDDEEYPFPDETCPVREAPFSCTEDWMNRPCKCDDDCALFDSCCPDVEAAYVNRTYNGLFYPQPDDLPDKMAWEDSYTPYMTCESSQREWHNPNTDVFTENVSFFLIGKCPEYVPRDSIIRLNCEEPPTSEDIFVTPMTVENIGHFKNFYCAMCHGIGFGDIMPWQWRLRSEDHIAEESSLGGAEQTTYTVEYLISLQVQFIKSLEPPSGISKNITARPCFPDVDVTMCSLGYSADSTIQMKCPSYLAPVKYNDLVYQNLACAYCNGIDVCINYTALCSSVEHMIIVQNDHLPSLAEYFAFDPSDDAVAASLCDVNEAFDPITRGCQVVYCLSGFVYNGTTARCERLPIDEVGKVCLSFYSQSKGQRAWNTTSSDIEYLAGAVNSLIIGSSYDMLASTFVLELSEISCNPSEVESHLDELCYEQNETMACQTCFEIELNFTNLIASNMSLDFNTSIPFEDTSCYFAPSFGNVSIAQITIDVPGDWTCGSYNSFFAGHTNDTILSPFRVQMVREGGVYETTAVTGEYICRDNLTLVCKAYVRADPGGFERVISDDSEETIRVVSNNEVIGQGKFQLMPNGSVLYCLQELVESDRNLPEGLDIMTTVGTSLSILSVLIIITTYTVFPKLRNMAGKSILALSVALLMTFLLMCLGVISSNNKSVCKAMAAATHFFWLSVFFWMNALAIDLNRTFGSRAKIRVGSKSQIFYLWYSLYAWGTPGLIVGACLLIDLCDCTNLSFEYGNDGLCWLSSGDANLYGFGVPLAALLFLNTILFSDTVVGIRLTKKASEKALKERPALTRAKEELSLYMKLSCVMGFTWIFAFVCEYANVPELWYIFTAVNSLQGVFILFAFGLNKRVTTLWKEKLGIKRKEVTSSQGDTKSTNTQNSTVN